MRLLLDTHALLWWLADDSHLGDKSRALIRDVGNQVLVSVVSLWEIVVKMRIGKLAVDLDDVLAAIHDQAFSLLDIHDTHLLTLRDLPVHHRDPFDHLLIAQAISEELQFVSNDMNLRKYPVNCISCS